MNVISLKVPDVLAAELAAAANHRGMTKSALVREAIQAFLREGDSVQSDSALSRVADLVGAFPGPPDLSVNKEYLKGMGE